MQFFLNELNLFPGENARITLRDAVGSPLVIPVGTTVRSVAASVVGVPVADLAATITDAAKGIVGIRLPDNQEVRAMAGKPLVYDLLLLIAGASKTISPGYLRVGYSPSVWSGTPLSTPPAVAPAIPTTLPPTPPPIQQTTLYTQDMIWVDDTGKKVMMRVKADGAGQAIELVPVN